MYLTLELPDANDSAPYLPTQPQAVKRGRRSRNPAPETALEKPALQIGDFTLGDDDCPSLTGHPNIRY